jgi:hypothetical protein
MRPGTKNIGKDVEMPHYRTPMADKMKCLNGQGYVEEFQMCDEGLKSLRTEKVFQPEDIIVVERQRFEGMSDPDDMAILYVIETKNGLKGTIVDAFGIYSNKELLEFMNKVKDQKVVNLDEICNL